jgi:hypothetical protein
VIGDVGVGWLMPAILVVAGVIGLLVMFAGSLRRNRPPSEIPGNHETTDDTLVIHEEEDR